MPCIFVLSFGIFHYIFNTSCELDIYWLIDGAGYDSVLVRVVYDGQQCSMFFLIEVKRSNICYCSVLRRHGYHQGHISVALLAV